MSISFLNIFILKIFENVDLSILQCANDHPKSYSQIRVDFFCCFKNTYFFVFADIKKEFIIISISMYYAKKMGSFYRSQY